MGVLLDASCESCELTAQELRLGATVEQMGRHDVARFEIVAVTCCGLVRSVEMPLGQPLPSPPCERCEEPLRLTRDQVFRITTMSGLALTRHRCPACGEATLTFAERASFQ